MLGRNQNAIEPAQKFGLPNVPDFALLDPMEQTVFAVAHVDPLPSAPHGASVSKILLRTHKTSVYGHEVVVNKFTPLTKFGGRWGACNPGKFQAVILELGVRTSPAPLPAFRTLSNDN